MHYLMEKSVFPPLSTFLGKNRNHRMTAYFKLVEDFDGSNLY